jgi:hypothetical protein
MPHAASTCARASLVAVTLAANGVVRPGAVARRWWHPGADTVDPRPHEQRLYATVTYGAATGRQPWVSRYHGYEAESVAVSLGTTGFVAGWSEGRTSVSDLVRNRTATP